MRLPLLASLAVHGALGVALTLVAVCREPAEPPPEVQVAVLGEPAPPEVVRPFEPVIPDPRGPAGPPEFPEEAPPPEPFEAPPEEPAAGIGFTLPTRIARLPKPLSRPARPAPPAAPHALVRAAPKGEFRPPRLLTDLSPEARYPARAQRMGLEGTVVLRLAVAADGTVGTIGVAESSGHEELDRAAAEAARLWRFEPARKDGVAVAYEVRLPVEFRLTG